MATKILAMGDSWFHYPKALDKDGNILYFPNQDPIDEGVGNIPYYLSKKYGVELFYNETTVEEMWESITNNEHINGDNFGMCGEELMVMVYGYSRSAPTVIKDRTPWLQLLKNKIATYNNPQGLYDRIIILLSAGGNDIANENLLDFVAIDNTNNTFHPIKQQQKIDYAINTQLKEAYMQIFTQICGQFPDIKFHFLMHGYDYAPVNGRKLITNRVAHYEKPLQRLSPGPWLKPFLDPNNLDIRPMCEDIIASMMDEFNSMLMSLTPPKTNCNIHYVDLRNTADRNNKDACWANELHYDGTRFDIAAGKFAAVITDILQNNA